MVSLEGETRASAIPCPALAESKLQLSTLKVHSRTSAYVTVVCCICIIVTADHTDRLTQAGEAAVVLKTH